MEKWGNGDTTKNATRERDTRPGVGFVVRGSTHQINARQGIAVVIQRRMLRIGGERV